MTIGFGNEVVASALARQARRGVQFMLSASGANIEVIRVARFMTGRHEIVIFGGYYHGPWTKPWGARSRAASFLTRQGCHPARRRTR